MARRKDSSVIWAGPESLRPLLVPVKGIVIDDKNARTHNKKNLEAIKQSLLTYGQRKPIVIQKKTNRNKTNMIVRAGNGTFGVIVDDLGWSHVAAVIVEEDDKTATGFAIADNRTGELSAWDKEQLAQHLVNYEVEDVIGFTEKEIDIVLEASGLLEDEGIPITEDFEEPEEEEENEPLGQVLSVKFGVHESNTVREAYNKYEATASGNISEFLALLSQKYVNGEAFEDVGKGTIYNILSMGAGTQSTALVLMAIAGVIPKYDHVIWADTQWDPPDVYEHMDWLIPLIEEAGMPMHTVKFGNLPEDVVDGLTGKRKCASIPVHVIDAKMNKGLFPRQCTNTYKVNPVTKKIHELVGAKRGKAPKDTIVNVHMGITLDERERANSFKPPASYITYRYPFLEMNPPMTRKDVIAWLNDNYPDRHFPRSSCLGCPFHSDEEWEHVRNNFPEEYNKLVEMDKQIRKGVGNRTFFLHKSLKPLGEVLPPLKKKPATKKRTVTKKKITATRKKK